MLAMVRVFGKSNVDRLMSNVAQDTTSFSVVGRHVMNGLKTRPLRMTTTTKQHRRMLSSRSDIQP